MANGYWRISPEILEPDSNYDGRYRVKEPINIINTDPYTKDIGIEKAILLDKGYYSGQDTNSNNVSITVTTPVFIPVGAGAYGGYRGDFSSLTGLNKPISVSASYTENKIDIALTTDSNGHYYAQLYFSFVS